MTSAGQTTAIRFVLGVSCRGFVSSVLLATVVATENLYAMDCSIFQIATTHVGAVVKADTAGIQQLSTGFKVNASTLKEWTDMSIDQKNRLYQTAVFNLIQAAAAAPFVKVTAGNVSLPNGIASLGMGQAGALINQLRANGIEDPLLFNLISGAAAVSGKPGAARHGLQLLGGLITVLQGGIAVHDATTSGSGPDFSATAVATVATAAQLGLSLMGSAYAGYGVALGAGSDVLTLVQSEDTASNANSQISQLSKTTLANLSELNRRIAKLKNDVQKLKLAEAQLAACQQSQGSTERSADSPTNGANGPSFPTDIGACQNARAACSARNAAMYCAPARSLCELCIRRRAVDREFYPRIKAIDARFGDLGKQFDAADPSSRGDAVRAQIEKKIDQAVADKAQLQKEWDAKVIAEGVLNANNDKCGVSNVERWIGVQ